jgi:tetratricopeptide (TPR) repeat protein
MAAPARKASRDYDYPPVKITILLALLATSITAQPHPGSFDALAAQAEAARQANQTDQAIRLYRMALELNPAWQQGWWSSGNLLYSTHQFAAARDAFNRLIQLNPQAAPAIAMRGLCEFETGDDARALADIDSGLRSTSIQNQPQIEQILRFHRALLLTRAAKFDQALAEFGWFAARGIKGDPLFAGIGLAALRAPWLPNQIPAQDVALYMTTGKVGYAMLAGDAPDADEGMRWLVQKFPKTRNLHYFYGSFLMSTNPEGAIDQFRQELELDPHNAAANAMLAWTLLNWGESRQALPYAQRAVQLEADSEIAQYTLGQALVAESRLESGIEHLQSAAKSAPTDPKPHIALAAAFWRSGKPLEARRQRELAVRLSKQAAAAPTNTNGSLE